MAASENQNNSYLDPAWVAKIYSKDSGEDFLGLRVVQGNITEYLIPGIITITPRARYYSFYSWALMEYAQGHPEGWSLARFLRRREQIFVLANLAWSEMAEDHPGTGGMLGSQELGNHWQQHREAEMVPLDTPVVQNYLKARHGGYENYSGVMRNLDLIRDREEAAGGLDILPAGIELARAFGAAIEGTVYHRQRQDLDVSKAVPRSVLVEYGSKCHLSYLAKSTDQEPTLEVLFAFASRHMLPPPDSKQSTRGNMHGSLGLILDMLAHTTDGFSDINFREAIAYGLCEDYTRYRPSPVLKPFLAHWQMFQLREAYVFALYALWVYFLRWLKQRGPDTLQGFCADISESVDLAAAGAEIGVSFSAIEPGNCTVASWMQVLLDASGIPAGDWNGRLIAFAQQSQSPLNEHKVTALLNRTPADTLRYFELTWLLLSTLYLRLKGISLLEPAASWFWAQHGGVRRRSMKAFIADIDGYLSESSCLSHAWMGLLRDYIIAQHTITALEKWRDREANTFHFSYQNGRFGYIHSGETGYSASRFRQAFDMLVDLGLVESQLQPGRSRLTPLGQSTLERVRKAPSDPNATD